MRIRTSNQIMLVDSWMRECSSMPICMMLVNRKQFVGECASSPAH